ncbi:hypothetical protein CXG81DRAFT_1618, partial [Caulochytrium protostelioides]
PQPTPTGRRAIYYYTSWSTYGRDYQVADLPEAVTDVVYAFFQVLPDGRVAPGDPYADLEKRFTDRGVPPLDTWDDTWQHGDGDHSGGAAPSRVYGNLGQLAKLKAARPGLRVAVALGGATGSAHFSPAVRTRTSRARLCAAIVGLLAQYPVLSGVVLDWEFPSDDGVNYGAAGNAVDVGDSAHFMTLLAMLRDALDGARDGASERWTLAVCMPADPAKARVDVRAMAASVDELHVMTYDFAAGEWSETQARFHTNPRRSRHGPLSCEASAAFYVAQGMPAGRVFLGGAFYSRGFANTDGPGAAAQGGSPHQSWEPGMVDYKALPWPGSVEHTDPESGAGYAYDPQTRVLDTYDTPASLTEKCRIVGEHGLGGIVLWEASADRPFHDPRSLMQTLY